MVLHVAGGRDLLKVPHHLRDSAGQELKRTLSIVTAFDEVSRTNAQGQARLKDLTPGTYRATARKDGLVASGEPVSFAVVSGVEGAVVVVMKAGG